jgi:hypothetical protein
MSKIQITLTVEESKELIARAVLLHPLIRHSKEKGTIILKGGTTVSKISEKLCGVPLRICGRITERGTVSVWKDTDDPHTLLVKNGEYENIDSRILEKTIDLGSDDLIVCSANAFDNKNRATMMAGSIGGGNIGTSLSRWYTEGVKVLIPVGIEKLVPGDLDISISKASRKEVIFSNGMSVGLLPLPGEIFTEIEAFKMFGDVEVNVIGAGGLFGASGSYTFLVEGGDNAIDNIISLIKDIKESKPNVSGETNSLKECSYPTERCGYHEGCSYKTRFLKEPKSRKLGIITIGQSPRVDFTKDIIPMLSQEFLIIEKGALDAYEYEQANEKFAPVEGDEVLVTRMRDGRQINIAEKHIVPLIQNAIEELEKENCSIILLMCTGKFPELKHKSLLIKPQEIIPGMIKKLIENQKFGLLIPDASQISQMKAWWKMNTEDITVRPASPYQDIEELEKAARELMDEEVDIIFMDCMGYTKEMKEVVKKITGKPVIIPRTLIAGIINEL